MHCLTFYLDLWVTRNVAQFPLLNVTYLATNLEVATSNGLGGGTFTRNETEGQMDRGTTDRLWYEINLPFFLMKKVGIITVDGKTCHELTS